MKKTLIALFTFISLGIFAQQVTIKGKVLNNEQEPVSNTEIKIIPSGKTTKTNSNGEFSITVYKGKYLLLFSHNEYENKKLEVNTNQHTNITIYLTRKSEKLDEVIFVESNYS
jgi:hypothetical protein